MNSLQPKERSLGYYIQLSYEFFSKKKLTGAQLNLLLKASNIDNSVLMMDDILDNSSIRNGKPTYHRTHGIPKAIIEAQINYVNSSFLFIELMDVLKTKKNFREQILKILLMNIKDVYLGEKIDMELENNHFGYETVKKKYFEMIKLFTGGHIYYGLAIGQLLAGKLPDKKLGLSAIHAGAIRQIVDDFNDYFEEHHEPFGDFITNSNRLPEILLRKYSYNKKEVMRLINGRKYHAAREILLTKSLRKKLYGYCRKEYSKMDMKHPLSNKILVNYKIILSKK